MSNEIIQILIIIFGTILLISYKKKIVDKFLSQLQLSEDKNYGQRLNTLSHLFDNILTVIIYIVAILMILNSIGINIMPILTGAGIFGLAISFGAQSLVKDIISGIFIITENTYNVGDDIKVADFQGKVYKVKLRTTILKDKDNNKIHIPNSEIQKVTVMKKNK